jgi:hypothetical protein
MFQPKKQQQAQITNIRLPKLPHNPGFEDLQELHGQAAKIRGRTVELPWTSVELRKNFMLSLKVDPDAGEPMWTMFSGDGEDARKIWEYPTGDMQLILNIVLGESTGGQLQDIAQQGAYAAAPKKPAGSEKEDTASNYQTATNKAAHQLEPSLTDTGTRRARSILEGDLKNMQVQNLLQSITLSKMTGRLGIVGASCNADVYFEEGAPTHAQSGTEQGEIALIELLMWNDGQFQFYQDERTSHRTVNKRLDSLLMEGMALLDQNNYLTAQGVTVQSYLLRKHKELSEAQFEQLVAKGAPLDMMLQKRFYQLVDNKSNLLEILRKLPLSKMDWIPVMFNMLTCDLLTATNKAPLVTLERTLPLEAIGIDESAIDTAVKALQRSETGLYTYPAFLFFLEQEGNRFEAFKWPYSLIIFEMRYRPTGPQGPLEPLPNAAVKEISGRIAGIKRKTDFVGHFETFDYACLLSNTNTEPASIFANRIVEVIRSAPVPQTPDIRSISLHIGVACAPDDCANLGLVLAAAKQARNRAKEQGIPIALFRDTRNSKQ